MELCGIFLTFSVFQIFTLVTLKVNTMDISCVHNVCSMQHAAAFFQQLPVSFLQLAVDK